MCEIKNEKKVYDLIVIGAGAAGLMAAGEAARRGRRVLLLEKMEKAGRKVRITGKGRCNVTNMRESEEFLSRVRTNVDFFRPSFACMSNKATVRFFERLGVKMITERGDRVFPKSGRAWDVADALVGWCRENGVTMEFHSKVEEIVTVADRVLGVNYTNKRGFRRREEADNVIVATGGVGYPATGSTGDGYRFAHRLGHAIEPVRPSLVPLVSSHPAIGAMAGLELRNISARLMVDGTCAGEEFGEIAVSTRGVEGAVVLRLSRDAVDALIEEHRVELWLDLKPALTPEVLAERIARERAELPREAMVRELVRKLVPRLLVEPVAAEAGLHPKMYLKKMGEEEQGRLIAVLKRFVLPISDYRPFEEAVVTAGGVRVDEVDPQTLQSKRVKGLYFAGEVLDLDADTGGYNLQIAFSTGRLAGQLRGSGLAPRERSGQQE